MIQYKPLISLSRLGTGTGTGTGTGDGCDNKENDCEYWAKNGYCTDTKEADYMKKNCCKACKSTYFLLEKRNSIMYDSDKFDILIGNFTFLISIVLYITPRLLLLCFRKNNLF